MNVKDRSAVADLRKRVLSMQVLGDRRYGSLQPFAADAIALHAREMAVRHPTRG